MTAQARTDFAKNRYHKLHMLVARQLQQIVNKHRVREISKYLDFSVPHLDLLVLMKVIELQPPELKLTFNHSFPKTQEDLRYLTTLKNRQIVAMKDLYRKKDDVTVGFEMQFSDGQVVRLGSTGDKNTTMKFRDTIWKV